MLALLIVLTAIALSLGIIFGYPQWQQWQRQQIIKRPFPDQALSTVKQVLPMYDQLTASQQSQLINSIQILLVEKQFIGCQGIAVTMEMKVTITAIASLLLLHSQGQFFPKLKSILVYPDAYRVKKQTIVGGGFIEERLESRLGESWMRDHLLLSWAQIQRDIKQWRDGRNLILHEFAHQLDQADGQAEGVPVLGSQRAYLDWAQVMSQEYQALCQRVNRGGKTVMDPYGTLNPAEFFAVATETFFEKSKQLRQHHPALYAQLQQYYGLHPTKWSI